MFRDVKDAAQDVVGLVEIPEGNEDKMLMLAGRLRKVPESFERYVSTTTRRYVGHVLGSVKSNWPHTPLDPLGKARRLIALMINSISICKRPPLLQAR